MFGKRLLTAAFVAGGIVAIPNVSSASMPSASAWHNVAVCESGNNPRANTGNGYYGMYQFTRSTWNSVGYSGTANQYSAGTQTNGAKKLYTRVGRTAWPVCGRYL